MQFLKKMLKAFLTLISFLFINKRNLFLFGSWDGHLYADNTKYLFEYINANCREFKCVWISKESSIVEKVKKLGYRAAKSSSIKGIYLILRAECFFETSGYNDISYFVPAHVKEIQLWHGMGFKNVGKNDNQCKGKTIKKQCILNRFSTYDLAYWMVASEEAKNKYSSSFDVPDNHFYITGQPKDDEFINPGSRTLFDELSAQYGNNFSKIVFYLPTHRNFGTKNDKSMLSEDTLHTVNEALKRMNVLMLYKPHYNDRKHFTDFNENFSNICFLLDFTKYEDIYEILPFCDAMISDYSGIVFGYLNANKPIILFPYDYDSYIKTDMGFCYDYIEVAAGPICYNWESVVAEIEKITKNLDEFGNKRNLLLNRFCAYHDGRNKERVVRTVKELLSKKIPRRRRMAADVRKC